MCQAHMYLDMSVPKCTQIPGTTQGSSSAFCLYLYPCVFLISQLHSTGFDKIYVENELRPCNAIFTVEKMGLAYLTDLAYPIIFKHQVQSHKIVLKLVK